MNYAMIVKEGETRAFKEVVQDVELVPGPRELLVRVMASAFNPVDAMVRDDRPGKILGWDAAGEVIGVGSDVERFVVGDRVYYAGALDRSGSHTTSQLVDERIVGHAPLSLTMAQCAALPLTSLTAWEGLMELAHLRAGERVLIINGAGGVGSIAIQLARQAGAVVVATASREETIAWAREMGAHHVINHREDLMEQLRELDLLVDVIFCCHDAAAHFDAMAEIISPRGRIVGIVSTSDTLPMRKLFFKSVTFAWELMFTRSSFQTQDLLRQGEILDAVAVMVDDGRVKSTAREVMPLSTKSLARAHKEHEEGASFGKRCFTHER